MEYIELSLENVRNKAEQLNNEVHKKNYDFDLVIFIAKGSYPIAKRISELNNVPLLEISATRKGKKIKTLIKPFMKFIPRKILIALRKKEMNSTYHENNNERNILYSDEKYKKHLNAKKILLVDDSIDSGYSIIEVKKVLEQYFKKSEIKIAVFNTMKKSVVKADFTLYEDMMICGPWSNDSKYFNKFIREYKEWKKEYER